MNEYDQAFLFIMLLFALFLAYVFYSMRKIHRELWEMEKKKETLKQAEGEHLVRVGYALKSVADSMMVLKQSFEAYNKEVKEYIELLAKKKS